MNLLKRKIMGSVRRKTINGVLLFEHMSLWLFFLRCLVNFYASCEWTNAINQRILEVVMLTDWNIRTGHFVNYDEINLNPGQNEVQLACVTRQILLSIVQKQVTSS